MGMLRRLRAALGIGVTWGAGWGAAGGIIFTLVLLALDPEQRSRAGWGGGMTGVVATSLVATVAAAMLGLVGGALFAMLLRARERTRSVDQLSLPGITLLGAAGSLALYGAGSAAMELFGGWYSIGIGYLTGTVLGAGVITAFGAASAAMTLRLAQRGSLDAGEEVEFLPPASSPVPSVTTRRFVPVAGER